MNAPDLESTQHFDHLSPDSLHKTKSQIFQYICKCLIQGLISFKYNNTCNLCGTIQYKEKRVKIMVKKCFVFYEEFIAMFRGNKILPQ